MIEGEAGENAQTREEVLKERLELTRQSIGQILASMISVRSKLLEAEASAYDCLKLINRVSFMVEDTGCCDDDVN